ncbi:hypothetical protein MRX96_038020 [Rhipicephalus microplus]
MALLRTCCCWLSVRKGSFACAIYTLIFYTMLVATGACHLSTARHSTVSFMLIVLLLILSGFCIVFSVGSTPGPLFRPSPAVASVACLRVHDDSDGRGSFVLLHLGTENRRLCDHHVHCRLHLVLNKCLLHIVGGSRWPWRRHGTEATAEGGQSGDRSALVRIGSWYMRWLSRKTALPRSDDTGAVPAAVTRNKRSHLQMPESPSDIGRCADESSTGRQVCTEETSVQPCVVQGGAQPSGCEAFDDPSVVPELQNRGITLTKEMRDHGGGFVPESQPLLDAPGFLGIHYQRGTPVSDRA